MPGVSGNVWRAGKGRYSRNMGAEEKNGWGIPVEDRDPMTKSQDIQHHKNVKIGKDRYQPGGIASVSSPRDCGEEKVY